MSSCTSGRPRPRPERCGSTRRRPRRPLRRRGVRRAITWLDTRCRSVRSRCVPRGRTDGRYPSHVPPVLRRRGRWRQRDRMQLPWTDGHGGPQWATSPGPRSPSTVAGRGRAVARGPRYARVAVVERSCDGVRGSVLSFDVGVVALTGRPRYQLGRWKVDSPVATANNVLPAIGDGVNSKRPRLCGDLMYEDWRAGSSSAERIARTSTATPGTTRRRTGRDVRPRQGGRGEHRSIRPTPPPRTSCTSGRGRRRRSGSGVQTATGNAVTMDTYTNCTARASDIVAIEESGSVVLYVAEYTNGLGRFTGPNAAKEQMVPYSGADVVSIDGFRNAADTATTIDVGCDNSPAQGNGRRQVLDRRTRTWATPRRGSTGRPTRPSPSRSELRDRLLLLRLPGRGRGQSRGTSCSMIRPTCRSRSRSIPRDHSQTYVGGTQGIWCVDWDRPLAYPLMGQMSVMTWGPIAFDKRSGAAVVGKRCVGGNNDHTFVFTFDADAEGVAHPNKLWKKNERGIPAEGGGSKNRGCSACWGPNGEFRRSRRSGHEHDRDARLRADAGQPPGVRRVDPSDGGWRYPTDRDAGSSDRDRLPLHRRVPGQRPLSSGSTRRWGQRRPAGAGRWRTGTASGRWVRPVRVHRGWVRSSSSDTLAFAIDRKTGLWRSKNFNGACTWEKILTFSFESEGQGYVDGWGTTLICR